jgi:hypothetical protein
MHLVYFLIGKSDALCNRPYGTYAPDDGDTDKQDSYDLGYEEGVINRAVRHFGLSPRYQKIKKAAK